ncbi:MAG: 50S ribosomal protein L25/general stress protein Ctc [Methylophilaceae bacterium]
MAIEINAVKRDAKGTGASRRLRRAGFVPGVVYGGGDDAVTIEVNAKDLFLQFRHESFHASVLSLNLDGKKQNVLLRDFQMHPVRNTIQHVDFQRVSATEKIHVKVPFHFINEDVAPGVKLGGGIVAHILTEAEVSCLAKDLPEFIEVDVAALEVGQSVHLSEIKLPKGVEFVRLAHDDDATVVSIAITRGSISEDAAAEAPVAASTETPAA